MCMYQVMEKAIERLERRHKEHITLYDPNGVSGKRMGEDGSEWGEGGSEWGEGGGGWE